MEDNYVILVHGMLSDMRDLPGWEKTREIVISRVYKKDIPISAFRKIAKACYDRDLEYRKSCIENAADVHVVALELAKEGAEPPHAPGRNPCG